MPFLGEDGSVQFEYGATFPSIVCAPLYACDLALQPGEVIRQILLGDASRWKVSPGTSGNGDNVVAHLVIKPSDVGLSTNLVIYTDRRSYNIRLVSKRINGCRSFPFYTLTTRKHNGILTAHTSNH